MMSDCWYSSRVFEHFCQMSSNSILIISSYTISKFVHFWDTVSLTWLSLAMIEWWQYQHLLLTWKHNTRKPSWCKGYHATAVHAWRPLAKKSTASKSTICDFLLMVNSNSGHITCTLRDIIMYRGWKSPSSPTVFWLIVDPEQRNAQ